MADDGFFYGVSHVFEDGTYERPQPVLYRSLHWAKSHFEIEARWEWKAEGLGTWTADGEWPRPVVFQMERAKD